MSPSTATATATVATLATAATTTPRRRIEVLVWNDCSHRQPDDLALVLADGPGKDSVFLAYLDAGVWHTCEGLPLEPGEVSHWAEMPAGAESLTQGRRRVYLSGPMTGLPDLNFPAFHAAAAALAGPDVEIVNPATLNPDPSTPWAECMRLDIAQLCTCDEIVRLPGWQQSRGAGAEMYVAQLFAMPAQDYLPGGEG